MPTSAYTYDSQRRKEINRQTAVRSQAYKKTFHEDIPLYLKKMTDKTKNTEARDRERQIRRPTCTCTNKEL
jgi:hypothetical protein